MKELKFYRNEGSAETTGYTTRGNKHIWDEVQVPNCEYIMTTKERIYQWVDCY